VTPEFSYQPDRLDQRPREEGFSDVVREAPADRIDWMPSSINDAAGISRTGGSLGHR
jgi:hypothetical protein